MANKEDDVELSNVLIFWVWKSDRHPLYGGMTVACPRASKIKAMSVLIPLTDYFDKLMVAYISDSSYWLQKKRKERLVSYKGKNLF